MWKYVNPGYGELLDENKAATVQDRTKNPTNGVSINNSSGICILIPNLQEVFLKFNLYTISSVRSEFWHVLLGDDSNYCGLTDNTYSDSSCAVTINNEKESKYNFFDERKVATFFVHVKNGQNGIFEAYINGSLIKAYSGNIKCSSFKNLKIYTRKNQTYISNIIISDQDIRDEAFLLSHLPNRLAHGAVFLTAKLKQPKRIKSSLNLLKSMTLKIPSVQIPLLLSV